MNYKVGLEKLRVRLPDQERFSKLKTDLEENLRSEQLFGSTEFLRNTRARTINELNKLAFSVGTVSFNEMCR